MKNGHAALLNLWLTGFETCYRTSHPHRADPQWRIVFHQILDHFIQKHGLTNKQVAEFFVWYWLFYAKVSNISSSETTQLCDLSTHFTEFNNWKKIWLSNEEWADLSFPQVCDKVRATLRP